MRFTFIILLLLLCHSLFSQYLFSTNGIGEMTLANKSDLEDFTATFTLDLADGTTYKKVVDNDLYGHATLNFPEDFGYQFNGKDWYIDAEIYVHVDQKEIVNEHKILPTREDGMLDKIYTTGDVLFPRIPISGDDHPDIHRVWTYNDQLGIHFVLLQISTDPENDLATTSYEQWTIYPNGTTDAIFTKTFAKKGANPVPSNLEIDDVNEDHIKELYFGVVYNDSDFYPQEYGVYQEGKELGYIDGNFSAKHKTLEMFTKSFEIKQRLERFYQQVGIDNSNGWDFF